MVLAIAGEDLKVWLYFKKLKSSKKDEYLKGRQFYRFNKDEFIVRLHIGLEDPKDLINDLKIVKKELNDKKFFPNRTALYALIAACFVVCVTMGVRQTFGLYSSEFEISSGTSNTEFGLAIAFHATYWGAFTPIFGRISDRHWRICCYYSRINFLCNCYVP